MLRLGILALLLCSQLTAPALSGKFVCMAANGCVCVDGGPETCTCCKIQRQAPTSCSCGCHEQQLPQVFEAGDQDCAHIAVGNYVTPVKVQASIDAMPPVLPVGFAVCIPPVAVASLARCSLLSNDSATLAVISTVVLRI